MDGGGVVRCLLCFSACGERRGVRPGIAVRRQKHLIVHTPRAAGARVLSLCASVLPAIRGHGEQGDISIRGARHDRIAAHKLKTICAKALPLRAQRKPQYARRTRATNTLSQKQLSHRTTTMADKWRVPQRLSIDPNARAKERDARKTARRTNTEDHFAPPR